MSYQDLLKQKFNEMLEKESALSIEDLNKIRGRRQPAIGKTDPYAATTVEEKATGAGTKKPVIGFKSGKKVKKDTSLDFSNDKMPDLVQPAKVNTSKGLVGAASYGLNTGLRGIYAPGIVEGALESLLEQKLSEDAAGFELIEKENALRQMRAKTASAPKLSDTYLGTEFITLVAAFMFEGDNQ